LPRIPPELCTRCKGYRRLCGLPTCPILDRLRSQAQALARAGWGRRVEGSSPPSALVGEHGYPKVNVYFMVPPGVWGPEARGFEDPRGWASRRTPLDVIVRLRSQLVGGSIRLDAKRPHEELYQREVGLAALSEKPVDSEVELEKTPVPRVRFDGYTKPLGPTAPARRVVVSDNPSAPKPLERAIWDDVKAEVAVRELYEKGVDVYTLQRALSLGFLGRISRRRLVPTRWAITAVDEILSRSHRERIRGAPEVSSVEVYYGEYLGNRFLVILKPGPGWIEWVEAWHPGGVWTRHAASITLWRVTEDPLGRRSEEDGGFSAAKQAVLEHLERRGRRADAIIVREILPEYYAPVGNWHIKETVRRALSEPPILKDPTGPELEEEASKLISSWGLIKRRVTLLRRRITLEDYMG
jgi:hypothetical protein